MFTSDLEGADQAISTDTVTGPGMRPRMQSNISKDSGKCKRATDTRHTIRNPRLGCCPGTVHR